MTAFDAESLRPFVTDLARRAGEIALRWLRSDDMGLEAKADDSPVTRADREIEEALRSAISARFPDHGVVGEEMGADREDAELVWMLDPIDGTVSYVAGVPLFGTLIALLHEGAPVLGAIHQPVTRELVIGTASGTTLNGRAVRVRGDRPLGEATLLTTDPGLIERHLGRAAFERFETVRGRAGTFRGWGDCYGYLLVATGRADVMMDPILNPWDLLPLIPVVRGAGGEITSWTGGDPASATSAVAATPRLHGDVVRLLAGD